MKFTLTATTLLAASVAAAPALNKRAVSPTDLVILNYALTLEHLEATFYRHAMTNFSSSDFTSAGYNSAVYEGFSAIAAHEAAHVTALTSVIEAAGGTAVQECTYSFPYTDVKSFVGLSGVLEGVGVSAYTGAAQNITDKTYLTAAASILAVEARHNAFVSIVSNGDPFPGPFDTPLGVAPVVSLAGSAPSVKAFSPLMANGTATAGSPISLMVGATNSTSNSIMSASDAKYCVFYNGLASNSSTYSNGACDVPVGFGGPTYVLLSSASTADDTTTVAGPAILDLVAAANGTSGPYTGSNTPAIGAAAGNGTGSASGSSSNTTSSSGSGASSGSSMGSSSGAVTMTFSSLLAAGAAALSLML